MLLPRITLPFHIALAAAFFTLPSIASSAPNEEVADRISLIGRKYEQRIIQSVDKELDITDTFTIRKTNYLGSVLIGNVQLTHLAVFSLTTTAMPSRSPQVPKTATVIAFFDESLKLRGWWVWPRANDSLSLTEDGKLLDSPDGNTIADFSKTPVPQSIAFEKKHYAIPFWASTNSKP